MRVSTTARSGTKTAKRTGASAMLVHDHVATNNKKSKPEERQLVAQVPRISKDEQLQRFGEINLSHAQTTAGWKQVIYSTDAKNANARLRRSDPNHDISRKNPLQPHLPFKPLTSICINSQALLYYQYDGKWAAPGSAYPPTQGLVKIVRQHFAEGSFRHAYQAELRRDVKKAESELVVRPVASVPVCNHLHTPHQHNSSPPVGLKLIIISRNSP